MEDSIRCGFSPTTCMALIDKLDDVQVIRERDFLLPPEKVQSLRVTRGTSIEMASREAIREHFNKLLGLSIDKLTSDAENLTNLISRHVAETTERVECASKQLEELQKQVAAAHTFVSDIAQLHTSQETDAPRLTTTADGNDSDTGTDCPYEVISNSCCSDFSAELLDKDVLYDRAFRNRRVAYYGQYPYTYPGGHHRARDFSESPYLNSIIKQLVEHFPQLKFNSAMVTAYNSHDASIPPHSDNEDCIVNGSDITTLSLGKARPVVFRRKPPNAYKKEVFNAAHGSVYKMSRQSQDVWDHAVPKIPRQDFTGLRVSITLRLLKDPSSNTKSRGAKSKINHPPTKRPLRVLVLSDSKNRTFDCSLLKEPIVTFRRDLFHLKDLADHQTSIEQSDVVLISAGVNDLRYGRTEPRLLHDNLRQYTSQFPNTQFIFDSVSPVALNADPYNKLNDSIDRLNKLLVQLSFRSSNFKLFDNIYFGLSHLARDGLHFNDSGKTVLSMCWVHVILITLGFRTGSLPLRRPYKDLYHDYMNSFV